MTIHIQSTTIECHNPSFEEWWNSVAEAMHARAHAPWIIGDLMNYGEDAYGERYAQALDECLVQQHTLENWRWVCRSVPPSRRREDLSFSHHETVAMFHVEHREKWLDLAESKRLSVHELRDAVRETKGKREVVIDDRFAVDFEEWMDETIVRADLLREIKRGTVEVVGFDKQKHTPVVKRIVKATKTSARAAA